MSQLIRATRNGDLDKVKLLVKNGININYQPYNTDGSALMRAVAGNQHPEIAKFLIKAGADLNLQDEVGDTALMYASNAGNTEMVKLLLKEGADPNILNHGKNNALHFASLYGHLDIVKILIDVGINIDNQDDDGRTPLFYAISYGRSETVKLLIELGADANILDNKGLTPISFPLGKEIYEDFVLSKVKVAQANQRLAFAKMMIDENHEDIPNDVVIKILKSLEIPPLNKKTLEKINNLLFKQKLQEELEQELKKVMEQKLKEEFSKKIYESIKEQFQGENIDDIIEFYRKLLRDHNLTQAQRRAYKRQKRTRKRKLGIQTGTSDQSSSRKSRSSPSEDLRDAIKMSIREARSDKSSSSRKSRSMHSSEELREALKMSIREAKSGSKKKMKKSKRK